MIKIKLIEFLKLVSDAHEEEIEAIQDYLELFEKIAEVEGIDAQDKKALDEFAIQLTDKIIAEEMAHSKIISNFMTEVTGISPEIED